MKDMRHRMTTKIDLHTHTKGSDGIGTPEQIVKYAVEAGLDGICLTDHHLTYTPESLEVAKACREAGLLVIHGCEYSTAQGHLLIYGVNVEDLELGLYPDMQEVIHDVNYRGGACIPAHPYKGYRRKLEDAVLELYDIPAIEVANGQCTFQCPDKNTKAVKAAQEMQTYGTGGSDAHNPRHIGLTYTEFQGVITCEREFLTALKCGEFRAVTARKRVKEELARRRKAHRKFLEEEKDLKKARAKMKADQGYDLTDPAIRKRYGLDLDRTINPGQILENDKEEFLPAWN